MLFVGCADDVWVLHTNTNTLATKIIMFHRFLKNFYFCTSAKPRVLLVKHTTIHSPGCANDLDHLHISEKIHKMFIDNYNVI